MRRINVLVACGCLVACGLLAEARTWESKSGNKVDASFVKVVSNSVYLAKSDGSALVVAMDNLSEADRKLAKELEQKRLAAPQGSGAVSDELKQLFGDELFTADRTNKGISALAGKEAIGVYFSAHWCPPCRKFTPSLVAVHNALAKSGDGFEVVFVSSDRSDADMTKYMTSTKMPWLAVPHGGEVGKALSKKYGVRGIPKLVIIDKEGKVITGDGRGSVMKHGVAAYDQWVKKVAAPAAQ